MNKYKQILMEAYSIAGYDNSFVSSCEEFFEKRGFLSKKQIEALQNIQESTFDETSDVNIY